MGCDIHVATQRRVGDKWERVERVVKGEREELFGDRNYVLFAVLANVRNRWGITPIAEPRGFPEDFFAECKGTDDDGFLTHEGTWMGCHSYSWLTLSEIETYDWKQRSVMGNNASVGWDCESFTNLFPCFRALADSSDDIRFVFGFDN